MKNFAIIAIAAIIKTAATKITRMTSTTNTMITMITSSTMVPSMRPTVIKITRTISMIITNGYDDGQQRL